jgi:hypothetical protein
MSIFNSNHIFVVFPPGAGGNFISGIISKLTSKDLTDLDITNFGSSHTVNNNKRNGGDSISFGTNFEENSIFNSIEEKETFYLEKIKKEYKNSNRVITWSHDYNNLLLYKKHFKNCKTLSITCFSTQEKLISILMHVNKVFLADEKHITIPINLWSKLKLGLKLSMKKNLEKLVKKEIDIENIFNLRFTVYNDLIFYLSTVEILKYAKLYDVLNLINEDFERTNIQNNIKELVLNYSDSILPYEYLKNKNFNLLNSTMSTVLDRDLSIQEIDFLKKSFDNYLSYQDWNLLQDPLAYFNSRKENAMEIIKSL